MSEPFTQRRLRRADGSKEVEMRRSRPEESPSPKQACWEGVEVRNSIKGKECSGVEGARAPGGRAGDLRVLGRRAIEQTGVSTKQASGLRLSIVESEILPGDSRQDRAHQLLQAAAYNRGKSTDRALAQCSGLR